MTDNKDKQKPTQGAGQESGARKPEASAAPAKPKPIPDKLDGKPASPAAPKKVLKEEFPPDEDEEAEDEEEEGFGEEAEDEELALDPAVVGTPDTSERIILVVDEEGQRRNETVAIITQILPNAVIEVANDPEEALEMMEEGDFDTFVVNFLMPGYSSSPFVKAVANHPEHPLLIGFAADKMSDAVDPKKGLKIIPLKRLFDLDTSASGENAEAGGEAAEE
jgi:CheY-like chemotaxis protein